MAKVTPADLRLACSQFATGVAVVTARSGDVTVGMTISSFSSVSLDPPLVLWSLRDNARSRAIFETAGSFAISVLSHDQSAIARRFASGLDDPFAGCEIERTPRGLPLIAGALASFECDTHRIYDGGDHRIIVGAVSQVSVSGGLPLLYFASRMSSGAFPPSEQVQP
jgi:flavin reductase (DIM6/NTAB) family NADH-FMN oxidoreductase RutF